MILRIFNYSSGRVEYIDEILVKMRTGGKSNKGLKQLLLKSREDYRILKKYNSGFPLLTLIMKNLRKIKQFIIK